MDINDLTDGYVLDDHTEHNPIELNRTNINSDQFDIFIKVMDELSKISANDVITINNSKIIKDISDKVYYCDLTSIIGPNRGLDIIDPKEYLPSLKEFKKSENISISYNDDIKSFVVSDGQMNINLPKYSEYLSVELPILKSENLIAKTTIDKKIGQKIKILEKKSTSTHILTKGTEVIGFEFLKGGTTVSSFKLLSHDVDKVIKCIKVIPFSAEDYTIGLYKYNNDTIALTIVCNLGEINIKCVEICKEKSDELSFSDIM